jgi:hypothetical protein
MLEIPDLERILAYWKDGYKYFLLSIAKKRGWRISVNNPIMFWQRPTSSLGTSFDKGLWNGL